MTFEPSGNSANITIVEKFTEANGTSQLQFVVLGKAGAVNITPVILSTSSEILHKNEDIEGTATAVHSALV